MFNDHGRSEGVNPSQSHDVFLSKHVRIASPVVIAKWLIITSKFIYTVFVCNKHIDYIH